MSRLNVANFRHPDGTADNINLDSSGNVGIGTTTPTDYNGNADNLVVGATSGNNGITVASGTTSEGSIFFADGTTGTAEYAGYVQYNHNGNYLRFGSASTEALRLDSSQNLQFNSGYGSVATAFGARAWIRFDGSAATIGSGVNNGNMDAVTDNGTGDYTVNFTTDMPDANYAIVVTSANTGTRSSWTSAMKQHMLSQSAGSCRIIGHHGTDNGEARNTDNINVVVFR